MLFTPWRVCTAPSLHRTGLRWASSKSHRGDITRFNILFCGSDTFSITALEAVLGATGDVWSSLHVLTSAKQKGRQGKLASRPASSYQPTLRQYAQDQDLPLLEIPQQGLDHWRLPKPFHELSKNHVLITASFGYILPDYFLHQFDGTRRLNLHPSLLPKYRGAAPIQWTIANGDTTTGVSVQRLVEKSRGIDGGEIVGSVEGISVAEDETYRTLLPKVASAGGQLLVDVLREMQNGTDNARPQDPSLISQAPKITHRRARIRWQTQSATQIERLSRAIGHQEELHTALEATPAADPQGGTESIGVQFLEMRVSDTPGRPHGDVEPGMGFYDKSGASPRLLVACAPEMGEDKVSWLEVMRVRKQSRKDLSVADWWNGLPPRWRKQKNVRFV